MTKKGFDLNSKIVPKTEEEKKDEVVPISFFKLFRFSTTGDKVLIYIGLISAAITGALQPLNTLVFGDLMGEIIKYAKDNFKDTDGFMNAISDFAIKNSLIGLGILIFTFISTSTFNYTALKQIFKIRSKYFQCVLNQDISWYDVNQTGDFASRMSDDLSKLEDGIGEKVPTFLNFQAVFIGSLVLALVKGWELALICLVSLPLSMISLGVIQCFTAKYGKNEFEAYGSAGAIAEEILTSIRTVIAFGGQQKEMLRYNDKLKFAKSNNTKRSLFTALGFGLLWFFIYGSYALAFWYGVGLIIDRNHGKNNTYDPSTMITVFFSVMTGSMNFGMSSPFIEAFGMAKAAGAKVYSIIDSQPIINKSKGHGDKIENIKGNIIFKDVNFHYPSRKDVPILHGLNLEIKSGDTVALVGSSGCGKSTCIQLIQRLYDPISGEIILDGKNLKDLDLTWMRENIGVVGQEPVLFGTTIYENIKYGNKSATEDEIIRAAKKANAHDFVKALPNGYRTMVGERGAQLSGGQKQRIAIARALVRNPSILLLDEATSALDNTSEAKVQAAIDSISKECTTIIIAHRLSTIRGANKIIVISNGTVVEEGDHKTLMEKHGEYFNLVTSQVKGADAMTPVDGEKFFEDDKRESVDVMTSAEEMQTVIKEKTNTSSIWTIFKMNSPEWFLLLLGSIGAVIMGFAMPVFAILLGNILGVLSNPDEDYVRSETNKYCLYFVIAGVISGISTFFQIYMFSRAGEKLTMRIRSKMFEAMLNQEMGFFDIKEHGVGALCARLSGEAAQVQGATGQRIGTILQSIATLGLAIGLSMYYQWKLGLVALAFTPLLFIFMYIERKQAKGQGEKQHKSMEDSTKLAVEAVSNIRTVLSLTSEDTFHQLYISELAKLHKKNVRTSYSRSLVMGVSRSLMFFAYAACMYYGGHLITKENTPYDDVFKVSQALIMGTVTIANALAFAPNLQKGITAVGKVVNLLERVPKIKDNDNAADQNIDNGSVQYSKINFAYPTRPDTNILKGLNLSILEGKTVALVGPSGCGKSTIIQLLERFYDPDSGTVSIDNNNLQSLKLKSLRSHLGIVSQEPNLFNKSIAENIAYGDNSKVVEKAEIIEAAKKANIHNFIASLPLGYETKLGEKGTQLSGGQKQRIAIARALVRNPKILLLDEATSALDTESEKVVQEALDNAKKGRTCITIAHRLTTIQDADLICVVSDGIIGEMGTHSELLSQKGLYYKLNLLQHKKH